MPASAPLITGSKPNPNALNDRYTSNSSVAIRVRLMMERRVTWRLMVSREVTENTPGPVITSRAAAVAPAAWSNAC